MADHLSELHHALRERGHTMSTAESLTGGELAATLTSLPGSSTVFLGGVVTYATELKRQLLGVTAPRVISAICAEQMATGIRELTGADWGLSTTGVAGPDQQEGEPVGTVFIAIASASEVTTNQLKLNIPAGGDQRALIRRETCSAATRLLLELVRSQASRP
ncbi:MAG TPA: CinA family protein [Marmoricola sp.]|nr:CinA family protein [Marmoricola sp.]